MLTEHVQMAPFAVQLQFHHPDSVLKMVIYVLMAVFTTVQIGEDQVEQEVLKVLPSFVE